MIPTKKASSDMKRAANPRNETTRLSALATGLRLTTTAAPKTSVSNAKVQNKNPDIFQATDKHRSNTDVKSEPEKPPTICVNLCGFYFFSFHFDTTPCLTPPITLSS